MSDTPNFTDLIGKKFRFGAKGPDEYDCYSLCQEVCKRVGINLPNQEEFSKPKNPVDYTKAEELVSEDHVLRRKSCFDSGSSPDNNWFKKIEDQELYSVIVFRNGPHYSGHIGVVVGRNKFIHIVPKRDCCIERFDSPKWVKRIEGFYRYVGQSG